MTRRSGSCPSWRAARKTWLDPARDKGLRPIVSDVHPDRAGPAVKSTARDAPVEPSPPRPGVVPTAHPPPAIALPIPGTLRLIDRGHMRDYRALARFHYRAARPATVCHIVAVRWRPPGADEECDAAASAVAPDQSAAPRPGEITAGVAVLSYPTPVARGRDRALGLRGRGYGERLRFANAHVRTISRVIVHPTFRALGLSTLLVRRLIDLCPTRYVEALACMGRAHPLFDRAGMTRFAPDGDDGPVYYLYDRSAGVA